MRMDMFMVYSMNIGNGDYVYCFIFNIILRDFLKVEKLFFFLRVVLRLCDLVWYWGSLREVGGVFVLFLCVELDGCFFVIMLRFLLCMYW